jgi:tRNA(Ile)-lysidine synthase
MANHSNGTAKLNPQAKPLQVQFNRQLAHLLGGNTTQPLAVAVSGGSDSMALLLLAQAFCKQHVAPLYAITIDHQLRPESGKEAAQVAQWLRARAIPYQVIPWQHDGKVQGNLQAQARQARYTLLAQACKRFGAECLLIGHTADDQAETVALRTERGAGEIGLAGMAARRNIHPQLQLLRPLLNISRQSLRDYLQAQQQPWLEDPSNEDQRFQRVKVRHSLQQQPERVDALIQTARINGIKRHQWERHVNDWLKEHLQQNAAGFSFPLKAMDGLVSETQTSTPNGLHYLALCRMLQHVGGQEMMPRYSKLARLWQQWQHSASGVATLAHCKIHWGEGVIQLQPETSPRQAQISAKALVEPPFYPIYLAE